MPAPGSPAALLRSARQNKVTGKHAIDQSAVADDWRRRGYSCGLWVDPPGQRWEDFSHGVDELVMLVEGELEMELAGEVFHPGVGEEIIIPARILHSVRNIGGTTSRWLYGYKEA